MLNTTWASMHAWLMRKVLLPCWTTKRMRSVWFECVNAAIGWNGILKLKCTNVPQYCVVFFSIHSAIIWNHAELRTNCNLFTKIVVNESFVDFYRMEWCCHCILYARAYARNLISQKKKCRWYKVLIVIEVILFYQSTHTQTKQRFEKEVV